MKFSHLHERLKLALREDAAFNDITTQLLPRVRESSSTAHIIIKKTGLFCGSFLISPLIKMLDPQAKIRIYSKDGQKVRAGQRVATVRAKTKAILSSERVLLNLLCHLSGVATLTSNYRKLLGNSPVQLLDTRKTTPLWRDLEKYAVACGGGVNHRFNLSEAILVKDNHLAYLKKNGSTLAQAFGTEKLKKLRQKLTFFAVEATNYKQVWDGIKVKADIILLDNMPENQIKGAMVLIRAARKALQSKKPYVEISGGIQSPDLIRLKRWGVDRVSVGALTHSAPALDISMEVD